MLRISFLVLEILRSMLGFGVMVLIFDLSGFVFLCTAKLRCVSTAKKDRGCKDVRWRGAANTGEGGAAI